MECILNELAVTVNIPCPVDSGEAASKAETFTGYLQIEDSVFF